MGIAWDQVNSGSTDETAGYRLRLIPVGRPVFVLLLAPPIGVWVHWDRRIGRTQPHWQDNCGLCEYASPRWTSYAAAGELVQIDAGGGFRIVPCAIELPAHINLSADQCARGQYLKLARETKHSPIKVEPRTFKGSVPLVLPLPFDVRAVLARCWGVRDQLPKERAQRDVLPLRREIS